MELRKQVQPCPFFPSALLFSEVEVMAPFDISCDVDDPWGRLYVGLKDKYHRTFLWERPRWLGSTVSSCMVSGLRLQEAVPSQTADAGVPMVASGSCTHKCRCGAALGLTHSFVLPDFFLGADIQELL